MKQTFVWFAVSVMLVFTLAWGAVQVSPTPLLSSCLTKEDVALHMERSRSGISLTCTEQIRLRNLRERTAQ